MMREKTYIVLSGILFALIAMLQLSRALAGWPARAGDIEIPLWPSWLAALIAGYLAVSAFLLSRKR